MREREKERGSEEGKIVRGGRRERKLDGKRERKESDEQGKEKWGEGARERRDRTLATAAA